MSMPILYGAPLSPFVRKVAVMLEEKNLPYEWKPVRPHDRDEEFRRLSPLGKIPAYRDDKIGLADSSVICFYLEKTHPEPALYPSDTLELVQALWWEEYFDGALVAPMSVIYFQRWANPLFRGKPTDETPLKEALEVTLPPMLAYLESNLKPDRWMIGDTFSIADISLATGFVNLHWADYKLDAALYPKLTAYVERTLARPSFKKCALFERAFIEKMKENHAKQAT